MFNQPSPPRTLHILRVLNNRKSLASKERTSMNHLQRGLEGEKALHHLLQQHLTAPFIPLYGIQLSHEMNEFQVDCLLLFQNQLQLLEVKNYRDDFMVEGDRWYHVTSEKEIKNPLEQLTRTQRLFTAFLQKKQINLPVISKLIFMDPSFYLYGATLSMPIIFPGQHHVFMRKLNKYAGSLGTHHEQIAQVLMDAHIEVSRHEYVPAYEYAELQPGIFCEKCGCLFQKGASKYLHCSHCGNMQLAEESLLGAVRDFQLLFPERQVTVPGIFHWTGKLLSKNAIRSYLSKHFTCYPYGRGTYYF